MIDKFSGSKLGKIIAKDKKIKKKKSKIPKEIEDKRIAEWQLFYLNNLDLFVQDMLGIPVKEFQKIVLNQSVQYDDYMLITSRGLGKTFIVGLIALSLCLLLPNLNVLVVSMTLNQSNLIIKEKIDEMFTSPKSTKLNSPLLQKMREEGWIDFAKDKNSGGIIVNFGNNSKIFATVCGESARGYRSNVIISDEAVLLPKVVYDRIIYPTSEPYKYKGLLLEPKEFFLTSAKTRDSWVWRRLVSNAQKHYRAVGEPKTGFFAGDIFTAIIDGIATVGKYKNARDNSDNHSFLMEYLNVWLGESADSIFKYSDLNNAQKHEDVFIPPYLNYDFCSKIDLQEDEDSDWIKLMSVDVAVVGGKENDRTVIMLGRVNIKTNERVLDYIYSTSGTNSNQQVLIIKRLFYQYNAQYMVLDTKGVGNVLYDMFTIPTFEPDFTLEGSQFVDNCYPAWSANTDKALQISSNNVVQDKVQRVGGQDTHTIIIPFAGTTELNSQMHYSVWNSLRNKQLTLPRNKNEMEQIKNNQDNEFFTRGSLEQAEFYRPYLETDALINETIALEVTRKDTGILTVKEKASNTKDRYICFGMFNLLSDKIHNKNLIEEYDDEDEDMAMFAGMYS